MAHTLTLTFAATTITLTSGDYSLVSFVPMVGDGKRVTESCVINISASSISNFQTDLQALWKAGKEAQDYIHFGDVGNKVFINFQPVGYGNSYSSQLYNLTIEHADELLRWDWANKSSDIIIAWERDDWWTGPELALNLTSRYTIAPSSVVSVQAAFIVKGTTLSIQATGKHLHESGGQLASYLANDVISIAGSGAGNDGGYTVITPGSGDSTHPVIVDRAVSDESGNAALEFIGPVANWVQVEAADVIGDLPALTKITVTNFLGDPIKNIVIGQNWLHDPANYQETLDGIEGESVSTVNAPDCRNGSYAALTITSTLSNVWSFFFNSYMLEDLSGGYFYIAMHFVDIPTGVNWVRFSFGPADGSQSQLGNMVLLDTVNRFQIVDMMKLPDLAVPTPYAQYIMMWCKNAAGTTLKLDSVHIIPTNGYRKLTDISGIGLLSDAIGKGLIDDGNLKLLYNAYTTDGSYPGFYGEGQPIMLQPGRLQRLYFYSTTGVAATDFSQVMAVSIKIYPRRRTI